jgi:hypothetical protein
MFGIQVKTNNNKNEWTCNFPLFRYDRGNSVTSVHCTISKKSTVKYNNVTSCRKYIGEM